MLRGFSTVREGEITVHTTDDEDEKSEMEAVNRIKSRLIVHIRPIGLRKIGGVERPPIVQAIVMKPREVVGVLENTLMPIFLLASELGLTMYQSLTIFARPDRWVEKRRSDLHPGNYSLTWPLKFDIYSTMIWRWKIFPASYQ